MKQNDAPFRAIVPCGRLEGIDQVVQTLVDTVDGVAAAVVLIPKELVPNDPLFMFGVVLRSIRADHVVDPLERVARDSRVFADELEVVLKRTFPMKLLVITWIVELRQCAENVRGL